MPEETQIQKRISDQEKLVSVDDSSFSALMDTARFDHLWRVANLFSKSDLVPQHYKGRPENCMITCQMAMRLNLEPLMLMQNTYIVHGRPGMEGKLVIALVNTRGPFTGPIEWKFDNEENPKNCTAFATHKVTGNICKATITWKMVEAEGWSKKEGSKWLTIPAQMFRYRSAVFLARAYCPEVTFGFPTVDELRDIDEPVRKRPVSSLEEKLSPKPVESKVIEDPAEPEKPKKKKKAKKGPPPKSRSETPLKELRCTWCGRRYRYGKEEGRGVECECGKGKLILSEGIDNSEPETETANDGNEAQIEVRFFCPDCDHECDKAKESKGLFQCPKCLNWDVEDRHKEAKE